MSYIYDNERKSHHPLKSDDFFKNSFSFIIFKGRINHQNRMIFEEVMSTVSPDRVPIRGTMPILNHGGWSKFLKILNSSFFDAELI